MIGPAVEKNVQFSIKDDWLQALFDHSLGPDFVTLSHESKDGDQGYPGNVKVNITVKLTANNELEMYFTATSNKATPISLTTHPYFNLKGHVWSSSITIFHITQASDLQDHTYTYLNCFPEYRKHIRAQSSGSCRLLPACYGRAYPYR